MSVYRKGHDVLVGMNRLPPKTPPKNLPSTPADRGEKPSAPVVVHRLVMPLRTVAPAPVHDPFGPREGTKPAPKPVAKPDPRRHAPIPKGPAVLPTKAPDPVMTKALDNVFSTAPAAMPAAPPPAPTPPSGGGGGGGAPQDQSQDMPQEQPALDAAPEPEPEPAEDDTPIQAASPEPTAPAEAKKTDPKFVWGLSLLATLAVGTAFWLVAGKKKKKG